MYERTRRMVANGDESVPVVSSSNGKSRNETSPNKGEKQKLIYLFKIINWSNSPLPVDVCLMEGHTIPRRLVSCPTKPGCRAIQKEGECCPEYQCGNYDWTFYMEKCHQHYAFDISFNRMRTKWQTVRERRENYGSWDALSSVLLPRWELMKVTWHASRSVR